MDEKKQILSQPGPPERKEARPSRGDSYPPRRAAPASPALTVLKPIDSQMCHDCLGAMTHRLAQPITALRGGLELGLMGKRTVADYRSILEQALQLADKMVEMIVSLRGLGESMGSGGPRNRVNLKSALEGVLAEVKDLAEARNLRIEFEAGGSADILADPAQLRQALQNLLMWVIQNSAGGGAIAAQLSLAEGTTRILLSPSRLDLQYLQIKMLDEITTPGVLYSQAAKSGGLGWVLQQRAVEALGGRLELLHQGLAQEGLSVSFPLAPPE